MHLLREFGINVYLTVFDAFFRLFIFFPQKNKSIFVTTFGHNTLHVIEALEKLTNEEIVIVKGKHCSVNFAEVESRIVLDSKKPFFLWWFAFVYHLATSNKVVVDNYYPFLATTNFKKDTKCVQLWHAAGAIKKFALTDESVKYRSKRAQNRFQQAYSKFTHVVIGSEEMASIFSESFGIPKDRMLRTGVPRTDFFYNEEKKSKIIAELETLYPLIKDKKIIMYAPTFRDNKLGVDELPLDLKKLHNALNNEYIIVIKTHPLVRNTINSKYDDFAIDLSHYKNINHLLLITDILITDYSSIPYEFSLLEKQMIFYAYDVQQYSKERGLWDQYDKLVPGPVVYNSDEIISAIKNEKFDPAEVIAFKNKWNAYSDGQSSDKLAKFLLDIQ